MNTREMEQPVLDVVECMKTGVLVGRITGRGKVSVDIEKNKMYNKSMKYTPEQIEFFRECGKKGHKAKLKKHGKEKLLKMYRKNAQRLNKKRWG